MAQTKKSTLTVTAGHLHDVYGNQVVLRGVNLPLLDHWEFPGSDPLAEILKSGANAVRIQWYIHYPDSTRPAYSITNLGSFLDRCIAAKIVPIVMLGDYTCQGDMSVLSSAVVPWWTSAEVMAVLQPRAHYLILNLANELGYYLWQGGSQDALNEYVNACKAAIAAMRKAGYTLPLMIDAPDGGASLEVFLSHGADLVSADPHGNILLSCHAYWAEYDGLSKINSAVSKHLPLLFGEIANKQDDTDDDGNLIGYYDLDGSGQNKAPGSGFTYQALLSKISGPGIGWLAWSWGPDNCSARMISTDGSSFSSLTPYGKDIVSRLTGTSRISP